MTYAQLESLINKWSLELEDQEKHFLQQATQVNAWDRTLIENGEKVEGGCLALVFKKADSVKERSNCISVSLFLSTQITTLHREVEKVKLDQKR